MDFTKRYYTVARIDGDYAHLTEVTEEGQVVDVTAEEKLVARALLPDSIEEGTGLTYELLQYRIR